MKNYVVGFAHDGEYMAFVRKNRPEWQRGKLNGIGGKVEECETFECAMAREFREETGWLERINWLRLVEMLYPQACIAFYTARVRAGILEKLSTTTDEKIEIHHINYLHDHPKEFIPNLKWLVPLAVGEEQYSSITVIGRPGNE